MGGRVRTTFFVQDWYKNLTRGTLVTEALLGHVNWLIVTEMARPAKLEWHLV